MSSSMSLSLKALTMGMDSLSLLENPTLACRVFTMYRCPRVVYTILPDSQVPEIGIG